jgi:hypothetical protein
MSTLGGELVKSTWVTRLLSPDLPIVWSPVGEVTAGDLLLCEVVRTGLHGRVETDSGSRRKLYAGDRIVCAVANRYATSLLEAVAKIDGDHADMISASGLCGRVVAHTQKASSPTSLRVLGQAFVDDRPLNLRSLPRAAAGPVVREPRWIVVVGSAMDSGKTTACSAIIRGLVEKGHKVGAAKVTGTASGRDFGSFRDAGANPVLDFLDAGFASTAGCDLADLLDVTEHSAAHLRAAGVDCAVIEIADGLLQPETRTLLEHLQRIMPDPEVVVTVRESMSAVGAVEMLGALGYRVAAVSGLLTNSPLIRREAELASGACTVATSDLGRWFAKRFSREAHPKAAADRRPVEMLNVAST